MTSYTYLRNGSLSLTDEHAYAEEPDIPHRGHSKLRCRALILIVLSAATIIASLLTVTSAISTIYALRSVKNDLHYSPAPAPAFQFSCGETATEARQKGCKLDISTWAWVPPACYDGKLLDAFLNESNRMWSLDKEGQQMVSEEFVRRGEFERIFVSLAYHALHCKYSLIKLNRALLLRDQSMIDGYIGESGHTEHCLYMIDAVARQEVDTWGTPAYVKFASCGQGVFDSGNGWFGWHNGEKIWDLPTN